MSSDVTFSRKPASAQVNTDKEVPNITIKPYTSAEEMFIISTTIAGYFLGATLGTRGPDHSAKGVQTVFCGLGGLTLAATSANLICKIWDRITQKN